MEFTYTPEQLDKITKLYHHDCEVDRCIFPDLAGLKNKLDISDEEYEAMENDEVYSKILRWAKRRRESWLTRNAVDNKKANGCKMLLAQPENGGYVDKPVANKTQKVEVTLKGFDGFKQTNEKGKENE